MEWDQVYKWTWNGIRSIDFYETEFEAQFLANIRLEYENKAKLWAASCDAPEYLQKADNALNYEEQKTSAILEQETKPKLVDRMIHELVTRNYQNIVDKETGCKYMFENMRTNDLELMYKVFIRDENAITSVIQHMSNYI